MGGWVHLRLGPPPQRVGKISQFVIDNLSMTEGDARKSKEKSQKSSFIVSLNFLVLYGK